MRGNAEDSTLIVLQELEPRADVGGMVIAVFERQPEIGTEKCRT
jgi:hypothetical protein